MTEGERDDGVKVLACRERAPTATNATNRKNLNTTVENPIVAKWGQDQ
jgi:hypothetical protein